MSERKIIPGGHYRHFKGMIYQVLGTATHTETNETLVIYQAQYGDFQLYARPVEMFLSPVDLEQYPNCNQQFRFEYIDSY